MTGVVERTEVLQPGPAEALVNLLDVPRPDLEREGLPLLWHWLYLLERPHQGDLGADGHPVRGAIPAPPGPGRRRMWAGGRVSAFAPLLLDVETTRRTEVGSSTEKTGRTGAMTFVVVRHTILQRGAAVVVEEQDIVYRDASPLDGPTPVEPVAPTDHVGPHPGEWSIPVDPTLLFRFSALTYNAHRIHYDRDYARDVEGYAGLVTHGPLQAIAMAEAARRRGMTGRLSIDYRLVSPLLEHQGLVVSPLDGDDSRFCVRDASGRETARSRVLPAGSRDAP